MKDKDLKKQIKSNTIELKNMLTKNYQDGEKSDFDTYLYNEQMKNINEILKMLDREEE